MVVILWCRGHDTDTVVHFYDSEEENEGRLDVVQAVQQDEVVKGRITVD
jgi:hypothetical protein